MTTRLILSFKSPRQYNPCPAVFFFLLFQSWLMSCWEDGVNEIIWIFSRIIDVWSPLCSSIPYFTHSKKRRVVCLRSFRLAVLRWWLVLLAHTCVHIVPCMDSDWQGCVSSGLLHPKLCRNQPPVITGVCYDRSQLSVLVLISSRLFKQSFSPHPPLSAGIRSAVYPNWSHRVGWPWAHATTTCRDPRREPPYKAIVLLLAVSDVREESIAWLPS